ASTCAGVASAGRLAVAGLSKETIDLLNGRGHKRTRFPRRIAFNCVPQLGDLLEGGATVHEHHVTLETRRVLDDGGLAMDVTAVRAQVLFGGGLNVHVVAAGALFGAGVAEVPRPAPRGEA